MGVTRWDVFRAVGGSALFKLAHASSFGFRKVCNVNKEIIRLLLCKTLPLYRLI